MNKKDIAKYRDELIFSLDIGTRSVVGVLGAMVKGVYTVFDYEQRFHEIRAMRDGQVEDIELVSKVCNAVKKELETRNNIKIKEVSIAAAGRALKTIRASHTQELADEDAGITIQQVRNIEYAAIAKAQEDFYSKNKDLSGGFQCVGYSVLQYRLDGYPLRNLEEHKGKVAEADIIAAFLPFSVVKSLYAVTSNCGLEVRNMTLEPIAAISVIVPPDVRLLNIAIADVGAGTSDIAVSKNGSIIAYDMVTTAGDELTESIMNAYLTEFDVSETVKKSLMEDSDEPVEFDDILGFTYSYTREEIIEKIEPAIDTLAQAISDSILRCNEGAPSAVFLIGGGSQIPLLCEKVADRLDMPANRVALGGTQKHKHIDVGYDELRSPEFVTPVGIGTVAAEYKGYEFFSIKVNGKKIMLMHTGTIRALDALLLAGIKATSLIGRSSRGITYFVNGQKRHIRGSASVPGQVEVNGKEATLESDVKQGDEIIVTPAQNGRDPEVPVKDIDEMKESEGYAKKIMVNGQLSDENHIIQNMDQIELLPADEVIAEAESLAEKAKAADRVSHGDGSPDSSEWIQPVPEPEAATAEDRVTGTVLLTHPDQSAPEPEAADIASETVTESQPVLTPEKNGAEDPETEGEAAESAAAASISEPQPAPEPEPAPTQAEEIPPEAAAPDESPVQPETAAESAVSDEAQAQPETGSVESAEIPVRQETEQNETGEPAQSAESPEAAPAAEAASTAPAPDEDDINSQILDL